MQDDSPDTQPSKPPPIPMDTTRLLECGGPWECLPSLVTPTIAAARRYIADKTNPVEARQRVYDVWIEGRFRPAWQPYRPSPRHQVPD